MRHRDVVGRPLPAERPQGWTVTRQPRESVDGRAEVYYLRWDDGSERARDLYRRFHADDSVDIPHREFETAYRKVAAVEGMGLEEIEARFTASGRESSPEDVRTPRYMTVGDVVAVNDRHWALGLVGWEELEVEEDRGAGPLGGGTMGW